VSPLKIKISSKNVREKPTNTPIIHSVQQAVYVWLQTLGCDFVYVNSDA
jgi:hypothetical protein